MDDQSDFLRANSSGARRHASGARSRQCRSDLRDACARRRLCASASSASTSCSMPCRPRSTPPTPPAASPTTTTPPPSFGATARRSASASGAARGSCIGPTARRCVTTNARWRSRSRKTARCAAWKPLPSGRTARACRLFPIRRRCHDETGKLIGAVNMLVDITERKRAEEQQALLVRELHHRVKNTLATVQAIMGSTARWSTTSRISRRR